MTPPSVPVDPNRSGVRQLRAARLKAENEAKQQAGQQATEPAVEQAEPESPEEQGTGPIGQGDYVVKDGDCISSIARDTGHFWETIWNDPGNAELKEVRKDPNVLLPGDRVTIPELDPKEEPGESEMRHRFVRRGEPAQFNMCVLENDEPRANEPFELIVDGEKTEGTTDPEGHLSVPIPGNAKKATLKVGPPPDGDPQNILEYEFDFGAVYPISEIAGVQQRLNNLGYYFGAMDNKLQPKTREAIAEFQAENDLPDTGELDEATRKKLEEVHGC